MIYSYDVFDTLITRLCGSPLGIFSIIENTLINDKKFHNIAEELRIDFFHSRIYLEKEARKKTLNEDITIEDIYKHIGIIFNLSDRHIDTLINLEIDTEYSYCVPITQNIEEVRLHIKQGETVYLLSDMYLRKIDIERLLCKVAPDIVNHCPLYVSSELKKTKHTGTLFDFIIEKYNISPGNIVHKGDNAYSDIEIPRKKGIKTIHYSITTFLNKEESKYLQFTDLNNPSYQLSSGIGKYCVINNNNSSSNIGSSIAAPLLIGYLKWLASAIKNDAPETSAIYFLARDGDILMEIAQKLDEWKDFPLEKKYLLISRQSALFSSITKFDEWTFDYLLKGYPKLNVSMISERCMIDEMELCSYLSINLKNKKKWLSKEKIITIKNIFKTNNELQKKVFKKAKEQNILLTGYLNQEGFFSNPDIVIVDLGWQCTIQDALHKLLKENNKNHSMTGYYFGITKYTPFTSKENKKRAFLFYPYSSNHIYRKHYYIIFVELFSSSMDCVTIHYKKENSKILPVKRESKISLSWIADLRKGIHNFITIAQEHKLINKIDYRDACLYIMYKLEHPTKSIARGIGTLHYSADPFDSDIKSVAPSLKFKDIFKWKTMTKWIQGSLMQTKIIYRFLFRINRKIEIIRERGIFRSVKQFLRRIIFG